METLAHVALNGAITILVGSSSGAFVYWLKNRNALKRVEARETATVTVARINQQTELFEQMLAHSIGISERLEGMMDGLLKVIDQIRGQFERCQKDCEWWQKEFERMRTDRDEWREKATGRTRG